MNDETKMNDREILRYLDEKMDSISWNAIDFASQKVEYQNSRQKWAKLNCDLLVLALGIFLVFFLMNSYQIMRLQAVQDELIASLNWHG